MVNSGCVLLVWLFNQAYRSQFQIVRSRIVVSCCIHHGSTSRIHLLYWAGILCYTDQRKNNSMSGIITYIVDKVQIEWLFADLLVHNNWQADNKTTKQLTDVGHNFPDVHYQYISQVLHWEEHPRGDQKESKIWSIFFSQRGGISLFRDNKIAIILGLLLITSWPPKMFKVLTKEWLPLSTLGLYRGSYYYNTKERQNNNEPGINDDEMKIKKMKTLFYKKA